MLLTLDKNVEKRHTQRRCPWQACSWRQVLSPKRGKWLRLPPSAAFGRGGKDRKAQSQALGKKEFRFVQIQPIPMSVLRDPQRLRTTPHQPIHYPAFPGEACFQLYPSQHPSWEHSPTSPIATNSCDSESYFQGNQKKKFQHQGKFQPQSSVAPEAQAPGCSSGLHPQGTDASRT